MLDWHDLGSTTLSLQSFFRIGSVLSITEAAFVRGAVSGNSEAWIERGLSVGTNLMLGGSLTVTGDDGIGSSLSVSSYARFGSSASLFSSARIGSGVFRFRTFPYWKQSLNPKLWRLGSGLSVGMSVFIGSTCSAAGNASLFNLSVRSETQFSCGIRVTGRVIGLVQRRFLVRQAARVDRRRIFNFGVRALQQLFVVTFIRAPWKHRISSWFDEDRINI